MLLKSLGQPRWVEGFGYEARFLQKYKSIPETSAIETEEKGRFRFWIWQVGFVSFIYLLGFFNLAFYIWIPLNSICLSPSVWFHLHKKNPLGPSMLLQRQNFIFLEAGQCPTVFLYHVFCVHSSVVDSRLFLTLQILNNAVMNSR